MNNVVSGVIEQAWAEVDEFVEQFDLAWDGAAVPDIADFLPVAEHPQYRETLRELIRVDLEFRWQRGCAKSIDEYRRDFPELLADAESLSQIAFEEYRARRHAGESVNPADYARRFDIVTDSWPNANQHDAPASGQSLHDSNSHHSLARRANGETTTGDFPEVGTNSLGFHLQSELGTFWRRAALARSGGAATR